MLEEGERITFLLFLRWVLNGGNHRGLISGFRRHLRLAQMASIECDIFLGNFVPPRLLDALNILIDLVNLVHATLSSGYFSVYDY